MPKQVDPDRPIENTKVFDSEQAQLGYRLNKFAMSMVNPKTATRSVPTKKPRSPPPTSPTSKNN